MKVDKPPKKAAKYTRTKSGGAVGDDSMEQMENWLQDGCGVDENVSSVGSMPNESVMHSEDNKHLR